MSQSTVQVRVGIPLTGGRLFAVAPASLKGRQFLPDITAEWSRTYSDEFKTAAVSVVLMRAVRPKAGNAQVRVEQDTFELV